MVAEPRIHVVRGFLVTGFGYRALDARRGDIAAGGVDRSLCVIAVFAGSADDGIGGFGLHGRLVWISASYEESIEGSNNERDFVGKR